VATVFKTINKSIICATVSFIVSGQKGANGNFLQFMNQAFWDVALFQHVEGVFRQGNIAYIFRIEQWKNNGIFL